MLDIKIVKQSALYAIFVVAYITGVATVMYNAEKLFGEQKDNVLNPIRALLLLVISAATIGMLIFGKPVMLYIDGKKREGVSTAIYTISTLAVFTVILFAMLFFMQT